jgi:SNF2 family DNA or RNA helicase
MSFTFYPFQVEDVDKIGPRKTGAIGSEMGTGKTYEAGSLIDRWYQEDTNGRIWRPDLIIAPLNTFDSWTTMFGVLMPEADVTVIDRKDRNKFSEAIRRKRGDVFLMHYEAAPRMPELTKFQFGTIVADEAHRIAGRKSQQTLAVKRLKAKHKLAMSGTLSGDNPLGLWSPLNWLWPGYYTSYWRFAKTYAIMERDEEEGYYKSAGPDPATIKTLHREMAPWYVRHLKRQQCCAHHPQGVMPWLKDKVYTSIWVDLTPTQRKFYEQMRKEMVAWVGELEETPLAASMVAVQLQRLSQMALATPVIEGTKWVWRHRKDGSFREEVPDVQLQAPSSKMEALLSLLENNPDKKFVVATSSKVMIKRVLLPELQRRKIGVFALTGDTKQNERDGMAKRFAEAHPSECQVFLGVIEAMAEGIDGLQWATDTMVFLDRSWKTIKNQQCEDRLHRDGQKDTVQIIDIMATRTVDLGRKTRLERKWAAVRAILGDQFDNTQELKEVDEQWQQPMRLLLPDL